MPKRIAIHPIAVEPPSEKLLSDNRKHERDMVEGITGQDTLAWAQQIAGQSDEVARAEGRIRIQMRRFILARLPSGFRLDVVADSDKPCWSVERLSGESLIAGKDMPIAYYDNLEAAFYATHRFAADTRGEHKKGSK